MSSDGGLRKLFRQHLKDAMWLSIETGGTQLGVPDSYFIFHGGKTGWIEFKLTKTDRVVMRPQQIAFADQYSRFGGRCFIAVRKQRPRSARLEACDELHLFLGINARAIDGAGLGGAAHHSWEGGPAAWEWRQIQQILAFPIGLTR